MVVEGDIARDSDVGTVTDEAGGESGPQNDRVGIGIARSNAVSEVELAISEVGGLPGGKTGTPLDLCYI